MTVHPGQRFGDNEHEAESRVGNREECTFTNAGDWERKVFEGKGEKVRERGKE